MERNHVIKSNNNKGVAMLQTGTMRKNKQSAFIFSYVYVSKKILIKITYVYGHIHINLYDCFTSQNGEIKLFATQCTKRNGCVSYFVCSL